MRLPLTFIVLCAAVTCGGCISSTPKSRYLHDAQLQLEELARHEPDAVLLHSLRELPISVREQLQGVSDVGQQFSADCTGPYAHQRFLSAMQNRRTYTVAIETGGIGYGWSMRWFVIDEQDRAVESYESASAGDAALNPVEIRPPGTADSSR